MDGVRDARPSLQGQVVQEHGGGVVTTVDPLGHLEHKSCLQCGMRDAGASLQGKGWRRQEAMIQWPHNAAAAANMSQVFLKQT